MQKYLFIDRDGTLIEGPASGGQIDSFDKLKFYPHVICNLSKIAEELDFRLVMVTNQNGLGTPTFTQQMFLPVQNFVIDVFKNEGILFSDIIVDGSYPSENSAMRKPRTGRMKAYMNNAAIDMAHSFVIGDRITDVQFAKNMGCNAIFLDPENMRGAAEITDSIDYLKEHTVALATHNWQDVYEFLKNK